ncbi:MAG: hypothetical protein LCI00_21590 [Chloroflexi bacterium]|nr:hypothetical protein [Chloroflexota bacterium]MCC6895011.1 hypothetical protein [Anaerolineae bacterium]
MRLTIDGIPYTFIPIKEFRAAHNLPSAFGINLFEDKDYTDLGRIDSAGSHLNSLRDNIMESLPQRLPPMQWLSEVTTVTRQFQKYLYYINDHVGLRDVEVEFAVAGFSDVLQVYAYALARAEAAHSPLPEFRELYEEWLFGTTKVFKERHAYMIDDQPCTVRVVAHAYGRIGLLIHAAQTYAVYDPVLACPAEGFMTSFLAEITNHMRLASQ